MQTKCLLTNIISALTAESESFEMAGSEFRAWELICYCVLFIVGIVGNVIVCLVVLKSGSKSHKLREVPFNVYLMALAIVDLTLAVVCLPIYLMSTTLFPHPTGAKGTIFCKIITGKLLPFWFGSVSIYILVIISFERRTAICKPFLAMTQSIVSRKTAIYIATAWFIGFIVQIPTIVGVQYIPSTGPYCDYAWSKTTAKAVYACDFIFQYAVPATIFIVNFYYIHKEMRKLNTSLGDRRQFVNIMKAKRKTVKIMFVVSAAFFMCWTPNAILYFWFQYAGNVGVAWKTDIYHISVILAFFNSCINPFLYAFQSREFQSHCRKVFRQMFQTQQSGSSSSSIISSSNSGKGISSSNQSNIRFRHLVELRDDH